MNRSLLLGIFMAIAMLMVGCKPEDHVPMIPAYLHLDKIDVTHNSNGATNTFGDDWLTSKINAVQIALWFEGETSATRLGSFGLPCTVPVITNKREIAKIEIAPFVEQNGIAATHIYYPYYELYTAKNIAIAPDSITNIGTKTSDGQWKITVPYRDLEIGNNILTHEFFEPQQANTIFDSCVTRIQSNDVEQARSGLGFGRASFKSTEASKTFFIRDVLTEKRAERYLYLEMDYRTDATLTIGMEASYNLGSNTSIISVLTLYPTDDEWDKLYINLGKAWKFVNYNPNFRICFTIHNTEGIDGNVDLDNLKVLSY